MKVLGTIILVEITITVGIKLVPNLLNVGINLLFGDLGVVVSANSTTFSMLFDGRMNYCIIMPPILTFSSLKPLKFLLQVTDCEARPAYHGHFQASRPSQDVLAHLCGWRHVELWPGTSEKVTKNTSPTVVLPNAESIVLINFGVGFQDLSVKFLSVLVLEWEMTAHHGIKHNATAPVDGYSDGKTSHDGFSRRGEVGFSSLLDELTRKSSSYIAESVFGKELWDNETKVIGGDDQVEVVLEGIGDVKGVTNEIVGQVSLEIFSFWVSESESGWFESRWLKVLYI